MPWCAWRQRTARLWSPICTSALLYFCGFAYIVGSSIKATPYLGMCISGTGLVCAIWTAFVVVRIRGRVRTVTTRSAPIRNYQLVIRVLIFSIFLAVGFMFVPLSFSSSPY